MLCPSCRLQLKEGPWPRCPRCHAPRGTGRVAAPTCIECAEWPEALEASRYARLMLPPATDLVHALKYEGWKELAPTMGSEMAVAVRRHPPAATRGSPLLVPVATTARRIRRRGYNQARLLADAMGAELGWPVAEPLRRTAAPRSQTLLTPAERRENVRGAFGVVGEGEVATVQGRDVLLVDDVLTTGATASEAAVTLVAAGARSVSLAVFARALPGLKARRGEDQAA